MREHLELFGGLRGLQGAALEAAVKEGLESVELEAKAATPAGAPDGTPA